MRNRILIICLACGLSLPIAAAQMHSALELSAGGGWSTLGYKVLPSQADITGTNNGSWGIQAHVGYAFFFMPNIGLGLGIDFSRYGAQASLAGTAQWDNVTDTEGEHYNHLALIHSLRDMQEVYFVEIPLTLYFAYPISYTLSFDMQLGAKYALPVMSKAAFHADIEHQGDYGIWGLNLHDVPGHGFYRERDFHGDYQVPAQNQLSLFLKLGLSYAVRNNIFLFGHIYGNYGLLNALKSDQTELGFRNDRSGMQDVHAFMPDYNGIIATNCISAKSHPIQLGLEIGVRFIFLHKKSYPCKCRLY